MFSDDSNVDLSRQGTYYSSIDGADDLAKQRYGSHDDYLIVDCEKEPNKPECNANEGDFDPSQYSLYAGAEGDNEGTFEYLSIDSSNVDEICAANPYDPIFYGPE